MGQGKHNFGFADFLDLILFEIQREFGAAVVGNPPKQNITEAFLHRQ
jgi:hypothetical protein